MITNVVSARASSSRFRGANPFSALPFALNLAVDLGLGGYLLAEGLATAGGYRVFGIALGAVLLSLGVAFGLWIAWWLRGIAVVNDHIKIARGFRSWKIAIADVAGIGLVYQRSPGTRDYPGWFLNLWTRDGARYSTRQFCVPALKAPKANERQKTQLRSFTARWPSDLALPHEDSATLAASRPGRIAVALAEAVARDQGDGGALQTMQLQKHAKFSPLGMPQLLGWWSPDGETGRTT